MKIGTMEGVQVKKRSVEEKQEEDDVYAMDTYVMAILGGSNAEKTGVTKTTPSKDNIVASLKRSRKPTKKIEAVGHEDEACTQIGCADTSDILGSSIIPRSFKLVVFNVHGTLLDCSLLKEKNPNSKIKLTLKATDR